MNFFRSTAVAVGLCTALSAGQAQGISVAGALNLPIGNLGEMSDVGFGVALRSESQLSSVLWGFRADFTFDRFGAKGAVDNFQYFTIATNLVHHSNTKFYQYGGLGLYNAKSVGKSTGVGLTPANSATEQAFGFQGGVGVSLDVLGPKGFMEVGMVSVLTSGRNSVWFPIRFGIRL